MSARRKFHCTQCLARDSSDYKRVARTPELCGGGRAKQTILHYVYSSTTSAPRARVLLYYYIYKTRRMKHSSLFCSAAAVRVRASVRIRQRGMGRMNIRSRLPVRSWGATMQDDDETGEVVPSTAVNQHEHEHDQQQQQQQDEVELARGQLAAILGRAGKLELAPQLVLATRPAKRLLARTSGLFGRHAWRCATCALLLTALVYLWARWPTQQRIETVRTVLRRTRQKHVRRLYPTIIRNRVARIHRCGRFHANGTGAKNGVEGRKKKKKKKEKISSKPRSGVSARRVLTITHIMRRVPRINAARGAHIYIYIYIYIYINEIRSCILLGREEEMGHHQAFDNAPLLYVRDHVVVLSRI
ncbi:unnamed protein product [Trichogramma brassicae]|uniref:Uncharacterized protein n=1 Tax=Trichogramma brassicae TaxID=86971 RepID=A0A6H5IH70_9HYME|nr:unnamed protein product [Trichogramma brassicae]